MSSFRRMKSKLLPTRIMLFSQFKWIKVKWILIAVIVLCLYLKISLSVHGFYMWRAEGRCINSKEEMLHLKNAILVTRLILNKYEVNHFLIFGSLWGALRYNDPLPWDYDFDFGIVKKDLIKTDIAKLKREFNNHQLTFEYQTYGGFYKVRHGEVYGDLILYEDYYNDGVMRRVGLESWLFFYNYRKFHQFPARLIKQPLPTLPFCGIEFPVPREGVEIQKYLYPTNWWIEMIPEGCVLPKNITQ